MLALCWPYEVVQYFLIVNKLVFIIIILVINDFCY